MRSSSPSDTLKFTYMGLVCTMVVSKLSALETRLPSDLATVPVVPPIGAVTVV